MAFNILETTIDQVHAAYRSGELTCRREPCERIFRFLCLASGVGYFCCTNGNALVLGTEGAGLGRFI